MSLSSDPILTNCIFWGDKPNEILDTAYANSIITYSCVQNGYSGEGNIDLDPLFVDKSAGDLHLTYPSPCRNSGDNSIVTEPCDFEGDPRICQDTVDMGADEFHTHLYYTGDATPGGAIQGKLTGPPDTWPVGLFLGSGVLENPLQHLWGAFWLEEPWFVMPLIPIPANGVLVMPATLPLEPPAPWDLPMQGLVGLTSGSLTNLCVLKVR